MSLLNNIIHGLSNFLHTISDHGNAMVSKLITYTGVASIGTGGVLGVASGTAEKLAQAQGFGWADYAAIVSIISGVCLIIKNLVDVYYTIKEKQSKKKNKE